MNVIFSSIATIVIDGWVYMALYAALAVAMIVELYAENDMVSRWMARTGALTIMLFIGLRWETGTDWLPYLRVFFTNDTSADYDTAIFGIDQGYLLFNQMIHWISRDYTLFLLVNSGLTITLIYAFIERSTKYPCMGVYLLYTSYVVTHFMGSNRRMLAIGLVCAGFAALRKEEGLTRNWSKWVVPIGVAATIHRTSIAALLGMVVNRNAWPARFVVPGLLVCIILGVSGAPFAGLQALGNLLSDYTGFSAISKLVFYTSGEAQLDANYDAVRQAVLGVAKRSTLLVIFIAYMHWNKPSEYAQRLYNIYILGCAVYFLMIGAPIFQIISTYYSIVEIALLPIIFYNLPQFKIPAMIYLLIVPFLLLLSSLIPYLELYVPYYSVFSL